MPTTSPTIVALGFCILFGALLQVAPARADEEGGEKISCKFDPAETAATCVPYACVPDVPAGTDENMITAGTAGFCGKCNGDRSCGGAACKPNGLCASFDPSPRPEPIWPHFHLLVTDVAFNFVDAGDPKPIISAGYLFQGAFGSTHPQKFDGHGYLTTDLPHNYWNVAATLAFAGPTQNVFVEGGYTRYTPAGPLMITTLSLGFEYQRFGASVWKVGNSTQNEDRVGPAASIGILQNVFLRATYVFPFRGPIDHAALIVGVSYMKDLVGDLLPDRFKKFLPARIK